MRMIFEKEVTKIKNGEVLERSENSRRIKQTRQQRSWQDGDLGKDRLGLPCCSIADGFSILLTLNSVIKLEELDLNKEN